MLKSSCGSKLILYTRINRYPRNLAGVSVYVWSRHSELVQLKLNIGASDGDSTPSEAKRGTPIYRSGVLNN